MGGNGLSECHQSRHPVNAHEVVDLCLEGGDVRLQLWVFFQHELCQSDGAEERYLTISDQSMLTKPGQKIDISVFEDVSREERLDLIVASLSLKPC